MRSLHVALEEWRKNKVKKKMKRLAITDSSERAKTNENGEREIDVV